LLRKHEDLDQKVYISCTDKSFIFYFFKKVIILLERCEEFQRKIDNYDASLKPCAFRDRMRRLLLRGWKIRQEHESKIIFAVNFSFVFGLFENADIKKYCFK
jgi:hypothetical protein